MLNFYAEKSLLSRLPWRSATDFTPCLTPSLVFSPKTPAENFSAAPLWQLKWIISLLINALPKRGLLFIFRAM